MSPPYTVLKAGLTALSLFGFAGITTAAGPDRNAPPGPPATLAPSTSQTVLLLTDGRVLTGTIARDGSGYTLRQKGGTLKYRPEQVERTFESIRDLYLYKAERLPLRDPDEQLKLARWCLTNHLNADAKTHLSAVLALSPKHREAEAMVAFLDAAAARSAQRDPEVAQAGFTAVEDRKPARLDARLEHVLPNSGLPRVFDLPPAQAVKRAEEFTRYVHPILQTYCASCHDETYSGEFQLIPAKGLAAKSPDVLRANLDATLRLVDPENPAKSEILASSLRPHGTDVRKRPIFTGSNDRAYQVLSEWVNLIKTPKPAVTAAAGHLAPVPASALPELSDQSGFATDRTPETNPGGAPAPVPQRRPALPTPDQSFNARYVPGQGMVQEKTPPAQDEFPVPFAAGGKPTITYPPHSSSLVDGKLPGEPATATPGAGSGAAGPPTVPPPATKAAVPAKKPIPAKPVPINDSMLEQLLQYRNQTR